MGSGASWLVISFVVGSIGFVLAMYGKKQRRLPHGVAGGVLLVYPYFVIDETLTVVIAIVVCALCWLAVKRGL